MQKHHSKQTNKYHHIVLRLRELLGEKLFVRNPKISWEPKQGDASEGMLLIMRGVHIPVSGKKWFSDRLEGQFKFKFIDTNNAELKQLCIFDVDAKITRQNLAEQNRTMSVQQRQFVDQTFFNESSRDDALNKILNLAANHLEKEIESQCEITFSPAMRARCKEQIIKLFKQQYSSGGMDAFKSPLELIALFEPIKAQMMSYYKNNQSSSDKSPSM